MKRRDLLQRAALLGVSTPFLLVPRVRAVSATASDQGQQPPARLQPPDAGPIPVAFPISRGAVVIDFCGPWEVFESVNVNGRKGPEFQPYTVAETASPVTVSGGMQIVPNYTFQTAPQPRVIVVPAQDGAGEAALNWIRRAGRSADLSISVCTGAFVLAKAGLLSGKTATTHHNAYAQLAMDYPDVHVRRGARFVEAGSVATSGGLSSGIDLALRVVERYYGHEAALKTADYMEYQGQGWTNPDANEAYRTRRVSTAEHPLCPVCEMDVDVGTAPRSTYKGQTYYFCVPAHKAAFDAAPESYLEMLRS
jgi:putative intracellular protease/amidase/YHS domain-containing protein